MQQAYACGLDNQTTGRRPIIAPVNPLAMVPDTMARMASGTISSRRSGIKALMPAIMMPTEPRLAKPQHRIDHDERRARIESAFWKRCEMQIGDQFVRNHFDAHEAAGRCGLIPRDAE